MLFFSLQLCICLSLFVVLFVTLSEAGVNSIKKYKCTLQVGSLFLQIHTNLNLLKVFTIPIRSLQLVLTIVIMLLDSISCKLNIYIYYACSFFIELAPAGQNNGDAPHAQLEIEE